jgi:hypothetical protein
MLNLNKYMNNTDRNNLAVFYGMKPYLKMIASSSNPIGIPTEIKKIQSGNFNNKEEFEQIFHERFPSMLKQFQEFKIKIEVIKKSQDKNDLYNFELIDFIYNNILSILEILEKLTSIKIDSPDFNPKDIQYSEIALLRELLGKVNELKEVRFKEVFHGNWTNIKMFGGILNPLNWIKKS